MTGSAPFIAVVGPTGSGKSEAGIRIAEAFGGEVINCDSLQIYRYLNIGTAKLKKEEQHGIPHHLMDFVEPDEVFSAGDYSRIARLKLQEIASSGRLPVVVGGTGFYLHALVHGLFSGPERDDKLRMDLLGRERRRPGYLHRLLRFLDPKTASRVHANDRNKLVRAVEVCLLTKTPMSDLFARGADRLEGFSLLKIALDPPRGELYDKLDRRARWMFENGLMDEIRNIIAMGYSAGCKPFESLGYRQAIQAIQGDLTVEEAIESTQRDTRRYAKRQWTWFRRDPDTVWVPGFGACPTTQEAVLGEVRQFLG